MSRMRASTDGSPGGGAAGGGRWRGSDARRSFTRSYAAWISWKRRVDSPPGPPQQPRRHVALDEAEVPNAVADPQPRSVRERLVATAVVVAGQHQLDGRVGGSRKPIEQPRVVLVRPHVRRVYEKT